MTMSFKNDVQLQNALICHTIDLVAPNNDIGKSLLEKLNETESFEERIGVAIKMCPVDSKYSNEFIGSMASISFDRLKIILNFDVKNIKKLQSPIVLLRPKDNPLGVVVEENYGLDKFTENLTVHYLEGNHVSIIENKDVANIINRVLLDKDGQVGKTTTNVVASMVENQREMQA